MFPEQQHATNHWWFQEQASQNDCDFVLRQHIRRMGKGSQPLHEQTQHTSRPNLLSSAFKDYFDQKNSMPGPRLESFCNALAAALSVQACNDHLRLNTSKEFPSAQRVREAVEKSSLFRGLISTNFHITGSYQFLSPSLSGHRAPQSQGRWMRVSSLSKRMRPWIWLQWSELHLQPRPAPWRKDSRAGLSC